MIILAQADQYRVLLYRPYPSRQPWPFHGLIVYETALAALVRRVATRAWRAKPCAR